MSNIWKMGDSLIDFCISKANAKILWCPYESGALLLIIPDNTNESDVTVFLEALSYDQGRFINHFIEQLACPFIWFSDESAFSNILPKMYECINSMDGCTESGLKYQNTSFSIIFKHHLNIWRDFISAIAFIFTNNINYRDQWYKVCTNKTTLHVATKDDIMINSIYVGGNIESHMNNILGDIKCCSIINFNLPKYTNIRIEINCKSEKKFIPIIESDNGYKRELDCKCSLETESESLSNSITILCSIKSANDIFINISNLYNGGKD